MRRCGSEKKQSAQQTFRIHHGGTEGTEEVGRRDRGRPRACGPEVRGSTSPCSLCLRGEFCLALSRPLAHCLTVLLVNFARRRFSSSLAAKAWFHACVTCATGEPGK